VGADEVSGHHEQDHAALVVGSLLGGGLAGTALGLTVTIQVVGRVAWGSTEDAVLAGQAITGVGLVLGLALGGLVACLEIRRRIRTGQIRPVYVPTDPRRRNSR